MEDAGAYKWNNASGQGRCVTVRPVLLAGRRVVSLLLLAGVEKHQNECIPKYLALKCQLWVIDKFSLISRLGPSSGMKEEETAKRAARYSSAGKGRLVQCQISW